MMVLSAYRDWVFQWARPSDLNAIQNLLRQQNLPVDDFSQHLDQFLLAFDKENLVGSVGLEVYGDLALLRSLAVATDCHGKGLGVCLSQKILAHARQETIDHIYLLTNTASRFFPKFGFGVLDREKAPLAIRETTSFRDLCPASATLLHLPVKEQHILIK